MGSMQPGVARHKRYLEDPANVFKRLGPLGLCVAAGRPVFEDLPHAQQFSETLAEHPHSVWMNLRITD